MGDHDKVDGCVAEEGKNEGDSKERPTDNSEDEATAEEIQDAKDFLETLKRRSAERAASAHCDKSVSKRPSALLNAAVTSKHPRLEK